MEYCLFEFLKIVWLTKAKEPSLPYYFLIAGRRREIHAFHKGISAIRNANSFVQDLNLDFHEWW